MTIYKGTTAIAGLAKNTIVTGFNIFDCKWSDHIINDIQWLRADTFSWQSGDVYVTAYNKLAEEYSTGTEETYTSDGIVFRRSSNGFKVCDASQESKVLARYNNQTITSAGNWDSWFYIIDTDNKRFKLPRTKWGFKGLRDTVGNTIAQTVLLPNITGSFGPVDDATYAGTFTGSFYKSTSTSYDASSTSSGGGGRVAFDASKSSSVYSGDGTDTFIQERATQMYLYFYVGEYSQTAIEQTAGITSEQLNAKVDTDLNNFPKPYLKTTYVNDTSGYNIWSNGYCEQWGIAIFSNDNANTVSFLKTFKNTNYNINFGVVTTNTSAAGYAYIGARSKSTGSFTIWANSSYITSGTNWKACGYLAEGQY